MNVFPNFHLFPRILRSVAAALLVTVASTRAATAPVTIEDVPRETQAGPGNARYNPPVPTNSSLPTLWLIGDSTVRYGSSGWSGPDGHWGWGAPITAYFDLSRINVVNRALGGASSRSFYRDLWKDVQSRLKRGDFVMIQFGANDHGGARGKGALNGIGEETEMNNEETVHTFGWYLRQYVEETRKAGATPIICSLTPRKGWGGDGKFARGGGHAEWAEQVAKATNTPFVPLNEIIGRRYDELGREKVETLYKDNIHTNWDGAVLNAQCVIAGLKALPDNPRIFSKRAEGIAPAR